jgi:hypothetical protein
MEDTIFKQESNLNKVGKCKRWKQVSQLILSGSHKISRLETRLDVIPLNLVLVSFLIPNKDIAPFKNRSKYFSEKGIEMVTIFKNLVDAVWGSEKPAIP